MHWCMGGRGGRRGGPLGRTLMSTGLCTCSQPLIMSQRYHWPQSKQAVVTTHQGSNVLTHPVATVEAQLCQCHCKPAARCRPCTAPGVEPMGGTLRKTKDACQTPTISDCSLQPGWHWHKLDFVASATAAAAPGMSQAAHPAITNPRHQQNREEVCLCHARCKTCKRRCASASKSASVDAAHARHTVLR